MDSEISPGVRNLVTLLVAHGFNTVDSGDGSNYKNGMECARETPHVSIAISPAALRSEACRLATLLETAGVELEQPKQMVQSSFDPSNGVAMLEVVGVVDADLVVPLPLRKCLSLDHDLGDGCTNAIHTLDNEHDSHVLTEMIREWMEHGTNGDSLTIELKEMPCSEFNTVPDS